jgi:hypothetical protein
MTDGSRKPSSEKDPRSLPERAEETSGNPWSTIPLVLAIGLSYLSMWSRPDDWDEVARVRLINFLVIGPLWAASVLLFFKGKTRIVLTILALLLPASGLSVFQSAVFHVRSTIPPRAATMNTIMVTAERIQEYMKSHRQAPPSLSDLPVDSDAPNTVVDGWGHDLQYSVDREGIITLTSFGADGKPGGEGRDADIVVRYRTRNADGTLNVDDESWLGNARVK